MLVRLFYVGAIAFLLSLSPLAWSVNEKATVDLPVVVTLHSGDSPRLHISLTNPGETPQTLYKAGLPWRYSGSLVLVLVTNDLELDRIKEAVDMVEPPFGEIRINPHETLTGDIDLVSRFPELPRVLRNRQVIVFWTYVGETSERKETKRYSGAVLIPKSDMTTPAGMR